MTPAAESSPSIPEAGRPAVFAARSLTFRYPGAEAPALRDVDLSVEEGMVCGVIGPNGSGKSTLLKVLLGALDPDGGRTLYRGVPPRAWGERELARKVGVVPQLEEAPFPLTVRDLVAMGRYPHLGPWRFEGPHDREAVERALRRCAVTDFGGRLLDTLSGGERQRVRIARALAQEPESLALDEPTASLDVRHEMAIFRLLRELARDEGMTVVVVTHNLNLAARFADRILLLDRGRAAAEGPPAEVLTQSRVEEVYGWPVSILPHPGPGPDEGAPQVFPLAGPPDGEEWPTGPHLSGPEEDR